MRVLVVAVPQAEERGIHRMARAGAMAIASRWRLPFVGRSGADAPFPPHGPGAQNAGRVPQKFTRFEIAPSTTRLEPVVYEEAGLARNTAALAISCGVAMRPVGLRASVSW